MTFGWAQGLDFEACRAVFGRERPVVLHRHGIGGERFELHLAAKAVCPADLGNADALRHVRGSGTSVRQLAGAPPAGAADLAAAAALAASSACALRCLRGIARVGLLRFSRFITPA